MSEELGKAIDRIAILCVSNRIVEVYPGMQDDLKKLVEAAKHHYQSLKPPKPYYYQDEAWCDHCDKDTQQRIHDTDHERDSSSDFRECLECHWTYSGMTGKYEPPSSG